MTKNNFLVAMATKEFGLIRYNKENDSVHFPFYAPEHFDRLELLSEGQQFFIDYDMYRMLGCQGIENRFTRLFVPTFALAKKIKQTKNLKVHVMDNLLHYVTNKNENDKHGIIFFMGNSNFLKHNVEHCDRFYLTVADLENDSTIIEKFDPYDYEFQEFKKRNDLDSKLDLEQQKQEYTKDIEKLSKQVVEIAPNGMKIIKQIDEKIEHVSTPEKPIYKFYEYLKF